jgi:protein SCO1/2
MTLAPVRQLFLFASCLLLLGCQPAPEFHATNVTGATWGRDFSLTDHRGQRRSLADFRGKAVVLFFGYTQCPDVCPTNLSTLREVMEKLGPESARVQMLFMTVDPERDTQALLAEYVPAFHPQFLGLYGDAAATAATAKEFRVFYAKQPGNTPTSYTIDHGAGSYVFDPAGRLRLYVKHGESVERIAADLRRLLAEPPRQ